MGIQKIWAVYFSPTGGTKDVVRLLAGHLYDALGGPVGAKLQAEEIDFTSPAARKKEYRFGQNDLIVFGSPVYAGRIPNKILPDWEKCFSADGAAAVPVVAYGNRSFGGALTEFRVILQESGFRILGAAAFVSRHAFTDAVGSGRPDEADRAQIRVLAGCVVEKLRGQSDEIGQFLRPISADLIPPYYTPLKEDGTPAKFLKAKPQTDPAKCDHCGICREACPVGSINEQMLAEGLCIKCQACVRGCPKHAKYFTDEDFLSHVRMLEKNYTARAENVFFI